MLEGKTRIRLHGLQFDKRRLVCCGKSRMILGWDLGLLRGTTVGNPQPALSDDFNSAPSVPRTCRTCLNFRLPAFSPSSEFWQKDWIFSHYSGPPHNLKAVQDSAARGCATCLVVE